MSRFLGFRFAAASLAAASVLALAAAASAATVTVSTTLDLQNLTPGQNGFTLGAQDAQFPPFAGFDLAEGDTLDFTIDFAGNQELTLINPNSLWAFVYSSDVANVNGTGSLSLLDTSGAVIWASDVKTDDEGEAHFGQYFSASEFPGLPSTITFGGLRYVGTANDYSVPPDSPLSPDVTTRHYYSPALYITAGDFLGAGAVPEPATWAMLIAGFGLLGATLRRRQGLAAVRA